jgi:hypothetical protein
MKETVRKFLGLDIDDYELIADMSYYPLKWAQAQHDSDIIDVFSRRDNGFFTLRLDLGLFPVARPVAYQFYLDLRFVYTMYARSKFEGDDEEFARFAVMKKFSSLNSALADGGRRELDESKLTQQYDTLFRSLEAINLYQIDLCPDITEAMAASLMQSLLQL